MERQQFQQLRARLRDVARPGDQDPRCDYSAYLIVQVLLWAAIHNKPRWWASDPKHWPGDLRPRRLPSQSCVSRRSRQAGVLQLIERFEASVRQMLPNSDIKLIDGRPLPTGGCSKDPDAGSGYAAGHKMRGYKLHLLCDIFGAVDRWIVTAMNVPEPAMATLLIDHLPRQTAYVLGDNNFDCNHLYEQAGQYHAQWLAPPREGTKGLGHGKHSDWRAAVHPWLRSEQGRALMKKQRSRIERINAWQNNRAVGLGPLPPWVRRPHRVQVWVALKLTIYHHWLSQRPPANIAA